MVILERMPDPGVVRSFRGTVDFYVDKGRVIARSWPQKRRGSPRLPEIYQQNWLREANLQYRALHGQLRRFYHLHTRQGTYTPRDYFMKHYFGTFPEISPYLPSPRLLQQAYGPDDKVPYWALLGLDITTQADGTSLLRIKTNNLAFYDFFWRDVFTPTATIHQTRRRGITFNRCWTQQSDRPFSRLFFSFPDDNGHYTVNLGTIQPGSGQRNIVFYIDAEYFSPLRFLRSFSHFFFIPLDPIGAHAEGIKTTWGIPRTPNLRMPFPYHSAVAPLDMDVPFNFNVPIPNQYPLLEPFRDHA